MPTLEGASLHSGGVDIHPDSPEEGDIVRASPCRGPLGLYPTKNALNARYTLMIRFVVLIGLTLTSTHPTLANDDDWHALTNAAARTLPRIYAVNLL